MDRSGRALHTALRLPSAAPSLRRALDLATAASVAVSCPRTAQLSTPRRPDLGRERPRFTQLVHASMRNSPRLSSVRRNPLAATRPSPLCPQVIGSAGQCPVSASVGQSAFRTTLAASALLLEWALREAGKDERERGLSGNTAPAEQIPMAFATSRGLAGWR